MPTTVLPAPPEFHTLRRACTGMFEIEIVESEMFCNLCEVTSCGGNGAPTPLDEYNLELEVLGDGEL